MSLADVARLSRMLRAQQRDLDILDAYYEGRQPLSFLTDQVRNAIGSRLTALVINWPELILDSLEQRLDVQGFLLGGSDEEDESLWNDWQRNNFDEESQVCHLEAMLYGRTAVSVWSDPDDPREPRMALETPRQMIVDYEPGTRKVRQALKQWVDGRDVYVNHYLPDRVDKYAGTARNTSITSDPMIPQDVTSVVRLIDSLDNPLGVPPVVPFVNRRRTRRMEGRSELSSVLPLADAVNKLATDMMVTSEFHAEPRRWATGVQVPQTGGSTGGAERDRLQAEVKKYWDQATTGKTWLAGQGVNFGQFQAADLQNFTTAIRMLGGLVAAISGLPPHYVGLSSEANPASAEAIQSSEASMVKRAKRKQTGFGGSHEDVMRLTSAIRRGGAVKDLPAEYQRMVTTWADPQTRSVGAMADAVQKLSSGENPIISRQTGQEWLGMSPQERTRDEQFRKDLAENGATADTQAKLELAQRLQDEQGLSLAAAYAAAGLGNAAGQIKADQNQPTQG